MFLAKNANTTYHNNRTDRSAFIFYPEMAVTEMVPNTKAAGRNEGNWNIFLSYVNIANPPWLL